MKSAINCALLRRQTHKTSCIDACVCQNKKICLALRVGVLIRILLLCCRIMQDCKCLASFFILRRRLWFYYLLRCHAAIQRDRDLCDLYRLCFGNWLCAFSFCLHISFQPAKNKSSLGSKIIPMYSSVTFQLQQCSARDACHMQFFLSFHLAVRHFIVHGKQRSFDELTRHDIDGSLLPNNIVE